MNFLPATVKGDKVELPFGTVDRSPSTPRREDPRAQALLIAGIRPEYFEDAAVIDPAKVGTGPRSTRTSTSWSGSATRPYALHPLRGAARGREPARGAGQASSTARRCARSSSSRSTRAEPGPRRRGGGAVRRRPQDAPVRPAHRREPHGGPLSAAGSALALCPCRGHGLHDLGVPLVLADQPVALARHPQVRLGRAARPCPARRRPRSSRRPAGTPRHTSAAAIVALSM